jgi:hypothetical protein
MPLLESLRYEHSSSWQSSGRATTRWVRAVGSRTASFALHSRSRDGGTAPLLPPSVRDHGLTRRLRPALGLRPPPDAAEVDLSVKQAVQIFLDGCFAMTFICAWRMLMKCSAARRLS